MANSAPGGASDFNTKMIEEFRANKGRVGGPWVGTTLILIHHIGARSGTERVTPLGCSHQGDGRFAIVASSGGSPAHPDWFVRVDFDGPRAGTMWAVRRGRRRDRPVPRDPGGASPPRAAPGGLPAAAASVAVAGVSGQAGPGPWLIADWAGTGPPLPSSYPDVNTRSAAPDARGPVCHRPFRPGPGPRSRLALATIRRAKVRTNSAYEPPAVLPLQREGRKAMFLTDIGYGLTGLTGLGIILIGARFLLAPRGAAAGFGLAIGTAGTTTNVLPFRQRRTGHRVGGHRLHPARQWGAPSGGVGWFMLAASIIPFGDAITGLRHNGPKATDLWRARGHGRGDAGRRRAASSPAPARCRPPGMRMLRCRGLAWS